MHIGFWNLIYYLCRTREGTRRNAHLFLPFLRVPSRFRRKTAKIVVNVHTNTAGQSLAHESAYDSPRTADALRPIVRRGVLARTDLLAGQFLAAPGWPGRPSSQWRQNRDLALPPRPHAGSS